MLLYDFMNENFTNLELTPPLFYSWDIGISKGFLEDNKYYLIFADLKAYPKGKNTANI